MSVAGKEGRWRRGDFCSTPKLVFSPSLHPEGVPSLGCMIPLSCPENCVDLAVPCVRETWAAILPALICLCCIVGTLPHPQWPWIVSLKGLFQPFLTLEEASDLSGSAKVHSRDEIHSTRSQRRTPLLFPGIALVQTCLWTVLTAFRATSGQNDPVFPPLICALSWAYVSLISILSPTLVADQFQAAHARVFTLFTDTLMGNCLSHSDRAVHQHHLARRDCVRYSSIPRISSSIPGTCSRDYKLGFIRGFDGSHRKNAACLTRTIRGLCSNRESVSVFPAFHVELMN